MTTRLPPSRRQTTREQDTEARFLLMWPWPWSDDLDIRTFWRCTYKRTDRWDRKLYHAQWRTNPKPGPRHSYTAGPFSANWRIT